MRNLIILISFTFITSLSIAQCADSANIYTFTYNGHTYEIVKELQTWDSAASCAVSRGGYLVEINSSDEQDSIYNQIVNSANIASNYVTINNGGGIAYIWIGATDQANEGIWIWDGNNDGNGTNFWTGEGANGANNGSAVGGNYTNWGGTSSGTENEPDNYGSGQNHAAIGLSGWPAGTTILGNAGEWNDIIGSSEVYYIIEYDNTSIYNNEEKDYGVYPNPTKNNLIIEIEEFKKAELYDAKGDLVLVSENKSLNIEGFNSGIYFLKIFTQNNYYSEKIIIN